MVAWHEVPGNGATPDPYRRERCDLRLHGDRCSTRLRCSRVVSSGTASDRTLRDGFMVWPFPGTSCQATIIRPFGTKISAIRPDR
jgi:hypothetical protein